MISKSRLKYYSSLLQKKYRNEEDKFLVEGKKLIVEALSSKFDCEMIIVSNLFFNSNSDLFENSLFTNVKLEALNQKEFEKLSDTKSPQGIIGVFRQKENFISKVNSRIVVALENISDPGNLGTIIRNCDWFGINRIILDNECAEVFNPKVIRASAGSVFHVEIIDEHNFYNLLAQMKEEGYSIICPDLDGISLIEYQPSEKTVIVFTNEANGPSENLLKISNKIITITGMGRAESLNVASASAIILFELTK